MRRKGVLLLGVIACWIALCTGKEESSYDYYGDDTISKELAEEYLFRAGKDEPCEANTDCVNTKHTCQPKPEDDTDDTAKTCQCAVGLGGDDCGELLACQTGGIYENCKDGSNGTCEYDDENRKVSCKCDTGKEFNSEEKRCRDTCNVDDAEDCKHGGKCEEKDGHNFCKCDKGLTGDKCETVFDCDKGKYKGCKGSGGECTYEGNKAVCKCGGIKKLDDKANVCKDCDCGRKGQCSFKEGAKTCDCQEGSAVNNERCQEKCNTEVPDDCKNGGTCKENGFCTCKSGLTGDKCETAFDCTADGKYKGCVNSGGKCSYDGSKAVCVCDGNKRLHDTENICKECSCGENEECSFKNGQQICDCKQGFAKKGQICEVCDCGIGGTCEFNGDNPECTCKVGYKLNVKTCQECVCGDNEVCSFKEGQKNCDCKKGFAKKGEKCEVCDCGSKGTCKFNGDDPECTCRAGYEVYEGKCKECDCRPGGKCDFIDGEPECTCNERYQLYNKKCIECDCGNGTCSLENGQKKCNCDKGLADKNGKCQVCDCGSNGDCSFVNGVKTCKCETDYTEKNGKCIETCTEDDHCDNHGKCDGPEGKKVCVCKRGTKGEKCESITDCETGIFSKCKESGGSCEFDGDRATCTCPADLTLDTSLKKQICRTNCSEHDEGYCKNGASCTNDFCKCPEGTEGDECDQVIRCKTLNCDKKEAKCKVENKKFQEATCECNNPKYIFEGDKCVANWCKEVCKGETTCNYTDEVGICKCNKPGQYYDYVDKSCKDYDRCFNKTCKGDLICNNGNCVCPENKKQNDTVCEDKDLCDDKSICFSGAKCEAGRSLGLVKCLCESESSFYNPKSGVCQDGSCFLNGDKKTCTRKCPKEMTLKDNNCIHKKNESICPKDCGFLGYCYKEGDKERCLCDPTYAEINKTSEKCILKASAVCPTSQLIGENKCKCEGKYKQAKNEITCELRSCSDEDVQKECKDIRAAKCVDNWKEEGTKGFQCVCPTGYVKDEKKGCIDPCSQDKSKDTCSSTGQMCYIGDRDKINECRCPPTFTYDETKRSCDINGANTFMIHGLPIISKKYETVENVINKVELVRDISASMKQTFANLDFVHVFSLKSENNVLFCEVWLQFQSSPAFNATLEVQRWKAISVKADNQVLLPPSLLLSSSHFDAASEEELTLCSSSVLQSFCGTGSTCQDNKCSCANGFRVIDATIRATNEKRILRCEDIDECAESSHGCKDNSICVNTIGSYYCKCKSGYKKSKGDADAMNQEECIGLCQPGTCGKGTCKLTEGKAIDCTCQPGYSGSYCNRKDENLAKAANSTKVVGAVLGTLLGIVIILIIVYIVRQRKNSYSEDFSPAPRIDNAEMSERRPMRGVANRAFQ